MSRSPSAVRMRGIAAAEFENTFGSDAQRVMDIDVFDPVGSHRTRLIADFGRFMVTALGRHEPQLLPVFEGWVERFREYEAAVES